MSDYLNTNSPTADNPFGTFKNESQPNAGDGTNIVAEHLKDLYYSLFQILQLSGEVPNGDLEDGNINKQFIKSLTNSGIFKYDSSINYKKNTIVINTNSDITRFYRSKIDNNTNDLNDSNYWSNWLTINSEGDINFVNGSTSFIGALMNGARLDVPEGWLRCDGAEYTEKIYPQFFTDYLKTAKIPVCTYAEYETYLINNNGNCGFFAIDTTAGTFKVPTFKDKLYITQALGSGNIGAFTKAGLPNIEHTYNIDLQKSYDNIQTNNNIAGANTTQATRTGITTINSQISSMYGNSDTVLTDQISYPVFICVANVSVPASEAQYNEFIGTLELKAKRDLSNITLEGKNLISTLASPDYNNKENIIINVEYISNKSGFIYLFGTTAIGVSYDLIVNGIVFSWTNNALLNASGFITLPISKGDVYKVYSTSGAINNYKGFFIPNKLNQ